MLRPVPTANVDIYQVDVHQGTKAITLTKKWSKHLYCPTQLGTVPVRDFGCFDAAGGAYVTDTGKLFVYASEWYNSLADVNGNDSTGVSEFSY